jgi:predicted 2-oxoglutarate/Fe(II)-dependent dioxygenase YbiX
MMLHIPGVLTADQVKAMRARLDVTDWIDGRASVGRARRSSATANWRKARRPRWSWARSSAAR